MTPKTPIFPERYIGEARFFAAGRQEERKDLRVLLIERRDLLKKFGAKGSREAAEVTNLINLLDQRTTLSL